MGLTLLSHYCFHLREQGKDADPQINVLLEAIETILEAARFCDHYRCSREVYLETMRQIAEYEVETPLEAGEQIETIRFRRERMREG